MNQSFPVQLMTALDMLIAEREEPFAFRPVTPLPEFYGQIFSRDAAQERETLEFEESVFLRHFLEEAEYFWIGSSQGRLRSGPWIESDIDDIEYSLEASALCWEDRKFLVIQLLGEDYEKRRDILQTAREGLLFQRQLEKSVQERTRELARTQAATIECLASLTETRDPVTGGHIKRTQTYVRLLAEHLKYHPRFRSSLDDETIESIYHSAPLHDIGKIGIPDRILLKPGKLSNEEAAVMMKHTIHGRDAIRSAENKLGENSFLRLAKEIAYTHHEKWDGSGYPEGLAGERIPVSGRLMAIADVYDALVTRRIYKGPYSHQAAVEIISRDRGTYFDPDMVEAFLEIEESFRKVAFDYADSVEEREALMESEGLSPPSRE